MKEANLTREEKSLINRRAQRLTAEAAKKAWEIYRRKLTEGAAQMKSSIERLALTEEDIERIEIDVFLYVSDRHVDSERSGDNDETNFIDA